MAVSLLVADKAIPGTVNVSIPLPAATAGMAILLFVHSTATITPTAAMGTAGWITEINAAGNTGWLLARLPGASNNGAAKTYTYTANAVRGLAWTAMYGDVGAPITKFSMSNVANGLTNTPTTLSTPAVLTMAPAPYQFLWTGLAASAGSTPTAVVNYLDQGFIKAGESGWTVEANPVDAVVANTAGVTLYGAQAITETLNNFTLVQTNSCTAFLTAFASASATPVIDRKGTKVWSGTAWVDLVAKNEARSYTTFDNTAPVTVGIQPGDRWLRVYQGATTNYYWDGTGWMIIP